MKDFRELKVWETGTRVDTLCEQGFFRHPKAEIASEFEEKAARKD